MKQAEILAAIVWLSVAMALWWFMISVGWVQ